MSEQYERLRQYREQAKESEKIEIEKFRKNIDKARYPKKCLSCFIAGIRYCRYWEFSFQCQDFEIGEAEELIAKFE